jgi:hypothetical protein
MIAPAAVLVGCCTKARRLAVPGTLFKLKTAEPGVPAAVAVTWNAPTCELAATETVATPVLSVATAEGPEKVTLAPVVGAVNVTMIPGTPLPCASCTLALSGLG